MEEGTFSSPRHSGRTDGDVDGDAEVDSDVDVDADPDAGVDWDVLQWDSRQDCEVRQILDRIADKWSLLVIALLDDRTLRFSELRCAIEGISQRMLTTTLRHLERDGLVRRTVHAVVPPRVDYELTPLGVSLHHTIQALVTWTEQHQHEIAAARTRYDTTRTS